VLPYNQTRCSWISQLNKVAALQSEFLSDSALVCQSHDWRLFAPSWPVRAREVMSGRIKAFMCEVHLGLWHYTAAMGKVSFWRTCQQSVKLVVYLSSPFFYYLVIKHLTIVYLLLSVLKTKQVIICTLVMFSKSFVFIVTCCLRSWALSGVSIQIQKTRSRG